LQENRTDRWSYGRLWRSAHALARNFGEEYRLKPGARVLVWSSNSPQLVATYFGAMLARLVLVPLDPSSTEAFIADVARESDASALIIGSGLRPSGELTVPVVPMSDLPFDDTAPEIKNRPAHDDLLEIVFTFGTTGAPKGVMLTHGNVLASVDSGDRAQVLERNHAYRLLSLLPLSHMFEQTAGLYLPLAYGSTISYLPNRQPSAIFKALRRQRIVGMVVVPIILELLMRGIEREIRQRGRWAEWDRAQRVAQRLPPAGRRLLCGSFHRQLGGSFRFFLCGGAYLPPALFERWERVGVRVIQGYGATECAPIITSNTYAARLAGSVRRPPPGVDLRLSEQGELKVRGANVTTGYWRNQAATAAAFHDGWYCTGDLGEMDAHGNVYLKGRLTDLIVLPNGLNVYPEDVERALQAESEDIADSVVLGLSDGSGGQRVYAAFLPVRRHDDTQSRMATAVRRANETLAPHQRVTGFTVWAGEDFPRTNTMKVKRHEVRSFLEGTVPLARQQSPAVRAAEDRASRIRQLVAEVAEAPVEQVNEDTDLALDLNIDSLGRVELAVRFEEELGVIVDELQLAEVKSVCELIVLLDQAHTRGPQLQYPRWARARPIVLLRSALQGALLFPLHAGAVAPLRVQGRAYLQGLSGPTLFIANHTSHVDAPTVLRALPPDLRRRVAVAAAADYFFTNRRLAFVTSLLLNGFPFSRDTAVRESLEYCGELVDDGWSILIYPEGTRSPTGTLQPFKRGIGLLAAQLRVPVVPIALAGLHRVLPKGARWPRTGPVVVRFGPPVSVPYNADPQRVVELLQLSLMRLTEVTS
jgi:long-chain acyl-CoA synthetase